MSQETETNAPRQAIAMFFETESEEQYVKRRNAVRTKYSKTPELPFQLLWHDRAVRQDIWLAAEKLWNERATNRDKIQYVASLVAEKCYIDPKLNQWTEYSMASLGALTRLQNLECESYVQSVTSGSFSARYQFWCFLEMLAFGVIPSDLLKIWDNTEERAQAQAAAMQTFVESLPHGVPVTHEQKLQRMRIKNYDDENPVIAPSEFSDIRLWTKMYLEAGYPLHYVTPRRSVLYLGKPHNPDVSVVSQSNEVWHSLQYYLHYGIQRLADAAKPKQRYKPAFLGRATDYFMLKQPPNLDTLCSDFLGVGARVTGVSSKSSPYLRGAAETFYRIASVSGKFRIYAMLESMIVLRTARAEETINNFISMAETSCFGKEMTQGRALVREAFWNTVRFLIGQEQNTERKPTEEIIYESAVEMIMHGADPTSYCALHLHGRGGLSTPLHHEDFKALPRGEREFYQPIFMWLQRYDNNHRDDAKA